MSGTDIQRWPSIPVADWQDTRDGLPLYTQVIGKVRLAKEPVNAPRAFAAFEEFATKT
jgi:hypothetical protein